MDANDRQMLRDLKCYPNASNAYREHVKRERQRQRAEGRMTLSWGKERWQWHDSPREGGVSCEQREWSDPEPDDWRTTQVTFSCKKIALHE